AGPGPGRDRPPGERACRPARRGRDRAAPSARQPQRAPERGAAEPHARHRPAGSGLTRRRAPLRGDAGDARHQPGADESAARAVRPRPVLRHERRGQAGGAVVRGDGRRIDDRRGRSRVQSRRSRRLAVQVQGHRDRRRWGLGRAAGAVATAGAAGIPAGPRRRRRSSTAATHAGAALRGRRRGSGGRQSPVGAVGGGRRPAHRLGGLAGAGDAAAHMVRDAAEGEGSWTAAGAHLRHAGGVLMADDPATADLVFLPWARRGGAAALGQPDTLGAQQPGVAGAEVVLALNGGAASVRVPVRLMGPGHVTGLDARQIVRTDPAPGSRGFEPNYFPLIEFDDPTLPWLFTPASANPQARLRPWLVLVVVRRQPGVTVRVPRGEPLPVLEIRPPAKVADELPDLAQSWAWAHAQVTAPPQATPTLLESTILTRPELSVSRLLCPRLLQPDTEYVACVVPAFELGRLAGLGKTIAAGDETSLQPAWRSGTAAPASLDLPVFHHWSFASGAGGDFESLALLLRPRPVPPSVGRRPIDISSSGLALTPPLAPGTALALDGALRAVTATDAPWPAAARQSDVRAATAAVLNVPAVLAGAEPILAPPL